MYGDAAHRTRRPCSPFLLKDARFNWGLTTVQFFEPPPSQYRLLLWAVLGEAVMLLEKGKGKGRTARTTNKTSLFEAYTEARQWIESQEEGSEAHLSFVFVCDALGLNCSLLRRLLLARYPANPLEAEPSLLFQKPRRTVRLKKKFNWWEPKKSKTT